jgi:hypothetical protein
MYAKGACLTSLSTNRLNRNCWSHLLFAEIRSDRNRIVSISAAIASQRYKRWLYQNLGMHFAIECSAELNIGRIGMAYLRD